jgi:hypothetical protein
MLWVVKRMGLVFMITLAIRSPLFSAEMDHDDPVAQIINGTRTTGLGCGARAIYLLLAANGISSQLSEITVRVDPEQTGICSAADIIKYFDSLSMKARLVTCNENDLLHAKEGILLILKNINNKEVLHFAYAMHSKEGGLELVDPTLGSDPQPIKKEWLARMWDGEAILVNHP